MFSHLCCFYVDGYTDLLLQCFLKMRLLICLVYFAVFVIHQEARNEHPR